MTLNWLLATIVVLTAAAAVTDWRTGHIPNRLILIGLLAGVSLQLLLQISRMDDAGDALAAIAMNVFGGALACAVVPLLLYRLNALGGGDVKLLITVGAVTGPFIGLQLLVYSFVVAAIYGPVRLLYEGRLLHAFASAARLLMNAFVPRERRKAVPPEALTSVRFGPLIFLAACLVAFLSWRSA